MDKNKSDLKNLVPHLILNIQNIVKKYPNPEVTTKADGTPVTTLDIALSQYIEEEMKVHFSDSVFYSEENFSSWGFPLIALDPLDGTREYISHNPEWAISLGAIMDNNFQGSGWVYNPKTHESFLEPKIINFEHQDQHCGEVSHSEWESGLFKNHQQENFYLKPVGSIAYKLGRLSAGKSDFVVSLKPKNIWDIAAGTILCKEAGLNFYSQGKLVTKVEKIYYPPLIWCSPELWPSLQKLFP